MNQNKGKKMLALVCTASLVLGTNGGALSHAAAKKPVFLSKAKVTMASGKSQMI